MRFRSPNRPRPRNYFSRREQWRLLLLVMSLGLVVILMGQVRRSRNTDWLGWLVDGGQNSQQSASQNATPANQAVPAAAEPTVRIGRNDGRETRYFPGVDAALLKDIRDNTPFRSAEKAAWFNLLGIVQRTSTTDVRAASVGEVGYVQLAEQPGVYRGKVVTVRGTVHQVTLQHPAQNDLGIESYYRLVIRPAGGGLWPIFAYVLQLPAGIEPGRDPSVSVTVTGFFFKNLSYQWQDGLGIAPVLLSREVTLADAAAGSPEVPPRSPVAPDLWAAAADSEPASDGQLAKLLSLAGWDRERLSQFADDTPLTDGERESLVDLLWRLRTFDAASIAAWTHADVAAESLVGKPEEHRGEIIRLDGRVRRVARHALAPGDAERLEMPAYFECELELSGGLPATVITARVPKAWVEMGELDEPVSVSGLFIKRLPGEKTDLLLVSKEIAWHPTAPHEPFVSFGESLLGTLGMDVGLLDEIRNHQPILASEREAFYQMLQAVGQVGANALVRYARGDLDAVRQAWASEAEQLRGSAPVESVPEETSQRLRLAEEVAQRAANGQYSVAPLFNDPDRQIGRLAVFEGSARRAVRIEVGSSPDDAPSDIAQRFGLDHYYEMEVFSDDSQDHPLVFCLRELPAGFPTGETIHEPVRVAGFFFKSWRYHALKTADDQGGPSLPQYAPLLIGRAPIWLQPAVAASPWPKLIGAGLFVVALAAVWGLAWWYARDDRRFANSVLAKRYTMPEGRPLDKLDVPDGDKPFDPVAADKAGPSS